MQHYPYPLSLNITWWWRPHFILFLLPLLGAPLEKKELNTALGVILFFLMATTKNNAQKRKRTTHTFPRFPFYFSHFNNNTRTHSQLVIPCIETKCSWFLRASSFWSFFFIYFSTTICKNASMSLFFSTILGINQYANNWGNMSNWLRQCAEFRRLLWGLNNQKLSEGKRATTTFLWCRHDRFETVEIWTDTRWDDWRIDCEICDRVWGISGQSSQRSDLRGWVSQCANFEDENKTAKCGAATHVGGLWARHV